MRCALLSAAPPLAVVLRADYETNAKSWQRLTMTDTISILNDPNAHSRWLIEAWGYELCR